MSGYRVTCHQKVTVSADLSETSIEDAIDRLKAAHSKPSMLVAPMSSAFYAGMICQKYGLDFVGVPDELMEDDSWMVCGEFSAIWSPGA